MTTNRSLLRPTALLALAAMVALPYAGAIPEPGLWSTSDQVQEDNPWSKDALPCNKEGIVWSGLGDPLVSRAVQSMGAHVCDKLMLDATVTMVRSSDLLAAGVGEDGQLSVRILFPIVKAPFEVPFRNQDPDTPTYLQDAQRDADAPVEEWVPYLLDPNRFPCTEGSTGVPSTAVVKPPMPWSLQATHCGGSPGANGPDLVAGEGINVGNAVTVMPPKRIGSVERLFLLKVTGTVPDPYQGTRTVYDQAFTNVAMVNNVATETLAGLQQKVAEAGATVQQTTFAVKAYLTEAQAAAGAGLDAITSANVPSVDDTQGVILSLAPVGQPGPVAMSMSAPGAGESASAAQGSSSSGCSPTYSDGAAFLTYANGCVASKAMIYEPGYYGRPVDHQYGRQVGSNSYVMVERSGETAWVELPAMAGRSGQTTVTFGMSGPAFKVEGAQMVRVTSLWKVRGDVDRSCDPQGSHCIANGANLQLDDVVNHKQPGTGVTTAAYREQDLLYASPLIWCAADTPLNIPLYEVLQPFVGCFTTIFMDQYDHQDQAFNNQVVAVSNTVDLQQYPGWLAPSSQMTGSVCCTSLTNIPSLTGLRWEFLGFKVEAA